MKIERTGSAVWSGGIKDGKGAISTQTGALKDYPYGFGSRFEGLPGSNPEELLGAAHAACFTMALSLILGEAGQNVFTAYPGSRWGAIGMSSKCGRAAWAHAHASVHTKKSPDFAPTLRASACAGGLRRCSACQ